MTEPNNTQPNAPATPYDLMGATPELIERLVKNFYGFMAEHEVPLAKTHRLTADGAIHQTTQDNFTLFLIEWLGGPQVYSPVHGHPRLRMRHAHVAIDASMRDAWLRSMQHALDKTGVTGEVRTFLDARFADVANFLRNQA